MTFFILRVGCIFLKKVTKFCNHQEILQSNPHKKINTNSMEKSIKISEISKLQQLLTYAFALVPIAAGSDKFLNLLTQWDAYLASGLANLLPVSPSTFMMAVGVVEIAAGILVFTHTRIGAYLVSVWLGLIALSLIFTGHYLDVAVRDLVMALSAFVLAKLTEMSSLETSQLVYEKYEA